MSDVSINIGREGSTISDSEISVGDVAGGNLSQRNQALQNLAALLSELRQRIEIIEGQLAGRHGTKGIHQQLESVKETLQGASKEIQELRTADGYTEKELIALKATIQLLTTAVTEVTGMMKRYEPMMQAMEMSYTSKVNIPVYVFYGVMALLFFFILVSGLILFVWRV